jgi:hypothetical protein
VCILLDLLIQTLTFCNEAFEEGNTQIKRQNFSTALVVGYISFLARDGDAPKRLSMSCSNSPCSTNNWKLCNTTKTPDTPLYIPSAQCVGYSFCSFAVLPFESPLKRCRNSNQRACRRDKFGSGNRCLTRDQYTLQSLHLPDSTATHEEHELLPASPSLPSDKIQLSRVQQVP